MPTNRRRRTPRRIEVTDEDRSVLMLGVGCYNPDFWDEPEDFYRSVLLIRGDSYAFNKRGLESLRHAWTVFGPEILDRWAAAQPSTAGHRPYAFWLFDHGLEWLVDYPGPGIEIRWPEGIESEQDMVYQHVAKARERIVIRERWRNAIRLPYHGGAYGARTSYGVPTWFYEKEAPAILAEPEVKAEREWVDRVVEEYNRQPKLRT